MSGEVLRRTAVPAGYVRTVVAAFVGLNGLSGQTRRVSWDAERVTVRSPSGSLEWYEDDSIYAFRMEGGEIRKVDKSRTPVYPARYRFGKREMDAIAVASVADLAEVVDIEFLTVSMRVDEYSVQLPGGDGNSARVVVSADTGVVISADGIEGGSRWSIRVVEESVQEGDELLGVTDVKL